MTDSRVTQIMHLLDEATEEEIARVSRYINALYKENARQKARQVRRTLDLNDKVQFTGGRPQYLQGLTGKIIQIGDTRAHVRLDRGPIRKFRSGVVIAPFSLLEKIS
jgi:hypothetical protein